MVRLRTRRLPALAALFAVLLSLVGAFPAYTTRAAGAWDGSVDISWYDPAKSEYYIDTPAQLAGLAALVNGMTDPTCPSFKGDKSYLKSIAFPNTELVGAGGGNVSDTVYGSDTDFAYKTVYLTADMDMGARYTGGAWSGPNWTPVGGKYPMKPSVVNGDCFVLDTRFNGVLDGQGHTVSNIYCDRYAAKGFPYSMAVGLVGYLGGSRDDNHDTSPAAFSGGWRPSVRNVVVGSGYVYARRMVGGVVGRVGSTSNGIVVENCANFAEVHNTDSKGIGGIVGSGWGAGVIRGCYNAGSVTTTYLCPAGGICGSNQGLDIYNCYNVGKIDSGNQQRGRAIGGHDSGTYTVANCYYLDGCDDDPESGGWYTGNSKRISVDVKAQTAQQMKSSAFIDKLNASGTVFIADSAGINGGYPVLYFQAKGYVASGAYAVTVRQPVEGGKIAAEPTGTVASGQTVSLTASADAGWTLKYFTLSGKPLDADFFTVSADSAVSAVFSRVHQVKVTVPAGADSYLSFSKTGYELTSGKMTYVTGKPVRNGDTLLEENVITLTALPYKGATPQNLDLEYTGGYDVTATNATKNTDGTFTVTGVGDVKLTVTQSTAKKSWLKTADTSWFTGEGESYTLKTPEQLAGMAYLVNVEGVTFDGVTISLGNDISLANTDGTVGTRIWESCGKNVSKHFSGTFDGRGHSVYDMTAYNSGSYAGLFGYCSGAVIKNVTVRGSVTGESSMAFAAGIAAYASGTTIENCVNRAEIRATGTGAAGIVAYTCDGTTVTGCDNRARVLGTSGVGGIVGICYSVSDAIRDCRNYGEITATGDNSYGTGGVSGQLAGLMSSCGSFADITSADRYTGGLAGYASARVYSKIEDSVSTGAVYASSANASAAVGGAVGYAQYLTLKNVSATGAVTVGAGFKSQNKGELIGRSGAVTREDAGENPPLPQSVQDNDAWRAPVQKAAPWTVTFTADGAIVGTAAYSSASQSITPPAVPAKAGYTAEWDNFKLGAGDLTVRAVYRPIIVRGGDAIRTSGTYFLDVGASGDITIADGASVTLTGSAGACEDLSVTAGRGASLTLSGVTLRGAGTLLTLDGGTLTLSGKNTLINYSDVKDNVNPTLAISGGVTIGGTGSLYVSAEVGNSAVKLDSGASLELKSGELTLVKEGLLGETGGALYANDASVKISGGVFRGYTNSDNVSVVSAKSLSITGGTVRAQAAKSPSALEGGVTITGGTLYCYGHSGNSSAAVREYFGADAISKLTGAAGCAYEKKLPFADVLVTDAFFESVRDVFDGGYFTGTSASEFSPNVGMTRAMFVTVLYRMAGSPAAPASNAFTDLTQSWYVDAVSWAVTAGITSGTSAATFSPNANVTLEQTAVFLSRYRKMTGKPASPVNGDNGAGASSWARGAAAWAVENGMLPDGCDFKSGADRAALAVAIARLSRM